MFQGIDHIALAARNPRALIDWYHDVLGFEVVWSNRQDRLVALLAGRDGSMIEMMPDNGKAPVQHELFDPVFRHLAIRVDDFDAAYEYLQAKGISFLSEPGEAAGGGRVVSFKDPEGNVGQ